MATDEPEEETAGFHRGFSKEVDVINRVYDRGGMLPSEWRNNLRKAGLILGPDEVEMPNIEMPPMADNPEDEEAADG